MLKSLTVELESDYWCPKRCFIRSRKESIRDSRLLSIVLTTAT